MSLLPDPGVRTGFDLVVYRTGNVIALLLILLAALAVLGVLWLGVYVVWVQIIPGLV